jgi:hypothetical protein
MFNLTITTGNAAFDDEGGREEVARLLQAAAESLLAGNDSGGCRDINGNRVGGWELTGRLAMAS